MFVGLRGRMAASDQVVEACIAFEPQQQSVSNPRSSKLVVAASVRVEVRGVGRSGGR